jgi:lipid-A-disaccharide synthase
MAIRSSGIVRDLLAGQGGPPDRCQVVAGQTRQVLRQADAAFVASGTATLETALMGCPMLVVYRTALLSYLIGRSLIRVDHLGMVNIVAGRTLCPEFIQHDATPAKLATAMQNLLEDEKAYNAMKHGLDEVVQSLGQGGPEQRVAEIIEEELFA